MKSGTGRYQRLWQGRGSCRGLTGGSVAIEYLGPMHAPPPGRSLVEHRIAAVTDALEVRHTADGAGRGLFARRDVAPGELLVVEAAFVWHDGVAIFTSERDLPSATARLLQMAPFGDGLGYERAPALSLAEVLAATMRHNAFEFDRPGAAPSNDSGDGGGDSGGGAACAGEAIPAAVAFSDALHLATLPAGTREFAGDRRALFQVVCLANHSCAPNARARELRYDAAGVEGEPAVSVARAEDGVAGRALRPPTYVLEARAPIAAGEEVRISYVLRTWRRARRAEALRSLWGFDCTCPRCSLPAGVDDTVVVRCGEPACGGGGRVYGGAAACLDCGAAAPPAAAAGGAAWDDAAMLALVFDGAETTAEMLTRTLAHPMLTLEDSRLFVAAQELVAQLQREVEAGESDAEALCVQAMVALAAASTRTAFINAQDLGVDVESGE